MTQHAQATGSDGPRRTSQIVIRQTRGDASGIRWSFTRSSVSAAATSARREARREPELPLSPTTPRRRRNPRARPADWLFCRAAIRATGRHPSEPGPVP